MKTTTKTINFELTKNEAVALMDAIPYYLSVIKLDFDDMDYDEVVEYQVLLQPIYNKLDLEKTVNFELTKNDAVALMDAITYYLGDFSEDEAAEDDEEWIPIHQTWLQPVYDKLNKFITQSPEDPRSRKAILKKYPYKKGQAILNKKDKV